MTETRQSPRWLPILSVAAFLAVAGLFVHGPERALSLARGVVRAEPSFRELPAAAAWSLLRMTASYVLSLAVAWLAGYWAAVSPRAARVILPLLDVGQSVPVLGFFPAAIYVFVTLLGGGRVALELASIFLIFTSQAWNLAFAVYEGISTIPSETRAAVDSMGVRGILRLRALLFPACVPTLLYNSILSWANGWYFLIACEIIVAGPVQYDLPGLGATLSRAISKGDLKLATAALVTLVAIVLVLELLVWRPLRAWSRRYRYDTQSAGDEEAAQLRLPDFGIPVLLRPLRRAAHALWSRVPLKAVNRGLDVAGRRLTRVLGVLRWPGITALVILLGAALIVTARVLMPPWPPEAASLPLALLLSFLRITAAYVLALLWIVPVALWASDHARGMRWLSLVAQVGASIPATGFFPVLVALLVGRFGGMEIISVALALTGMQWYLLFNLLAGVHAIPGDLKEATRSLGLRGWRRFRTLTFPAMLPSLITGSITGWGGGWNALIVSEFLEFGGQRYSVLGIGQMLQEATDLPGNPPMMVLSLTAMVVVIVLMNRLFWRRMYTAAADRFKIEY